MESRTMLDFDYVDWDDEDDLAGNSWHIAAAGLTPVEVEEVLRSPDADPDTSDSSGRPAVFGYTINGKYLIVVYDRSEENRVIVIRPRTAFEVDPPD
jgi:hypothetical protein